ncbi:MAG: sensor histidine kinase [Myxococcota bacterium]
MTGERAGGQLLPVGMLVEAGVQWFHFPLRPEGPSMQAYFGLPQTVVTHFTPPEVLASRSALAVLESFLSQIHPEDRAYLQGYVGQHLQGSEPTSFSSGRFRGLDEHGDYRWYEIRSRIRPHEDLIIAEGIVIDVHEAQTTSDQLFISLREKETLLKEVYHRVKNNLQIVSSLLTLQGETLDDEKQRLPLLDSASRVRSMALVHQQLYTEATLSRVPLMDYVRELGNSLVGSTRAPLELQIQGDHVEVDLELAVPCGLILNELLMNAIRHGASPDGISRVHISLTNATTHFELRIADQGPGLPEGFSPFRRETLGLRLIESLSRQIRAKIVAESRDGAVFSLQIPLPSR